MKRFFHAPLWLVAIALLARLSSTPSEASGQDDLGRTHRPPIQQHYTPASGYTATLYRSREEGEPHHFILRQGSKVVVELDSPLRIKVHELAPYLVVSVVQGGWRCISHVLILQPQFKELYVLKTIGADFRLDPRGHLIAQSWDNTMRPKPYPWILLRWGGSDFRLARDLMKRSISAETSGEWLGLVAEHAGEDFWRSRLMFVCNRALYSGHPEIFRRALQVCPSPLAEKRKFLAKYRQQLRKSPWASQLEADLPTL
jgi:hypothetical protein